MTGTAYKSYLVLNNYSTSDICCDHYHHNNYHIKKNCCTSYIFFSLLLSASLLLAFSLFKTSLSLQESRYLTLESGRPESSRNTLTCDYSHGRWIYDPDSATSMRYDYTCKEIFKGWNCIAGNKSNALDILKWRWKPNDCDLPHFDPLLFLQLYRDTNIGGRTANANGGVLESLGYKEGYRIDVDIPDGNWVDAPTFHDILIFNTGHWWRAPSKFDPVKSPMIFFENGLPITPPISPYIGLDIVLRHTVSYMEEKSRQQNKIVFFRTLSPRHFEGGDWDQGGSCNRIQPLLPQQVEEFFSVNKNGTNVETRVVNNHVYNVIEDSSSFRILNISGMSEFRADAPPSSAGGKKHDDCMHWCLPGITDTWNDLFVAHLNNLKPQNT